MTPFWLAPIFAIALGALYVCMADAGRASKLVVAGAVLLSLFLQFGAGSLPLWAAGLVLQVVVSVYVLLCLRVPR